MTHIFAKSFAIVLFSGCCLTAADIGAACAQEQFSSGDSSDNSDGSPGAGGGPGGGTGGGSHSRGSSAPPHPGPAYVTGAANPCQPAGPGSYNWLANPPSVPLPPGCVRPPEGKTVTYKKTDPRFENLPQNSQRNAPTRPGTVTISKTDPNFQILPQNTQRVAPTRPGTVTISKTDPNFQILPQNTKRVAPTRPGTVTISKTDPNYQVLPQNTQRVPPSPPAAGIYRQDTEAMKPRLEDSTTPANPVRK